MSLLKIDRLIPDYVTHVSASMDKGVFTLTEKGWELARNIRGSEARSEGEAIIAVNFIPSNCVAN